MDKEFWLKVVVLMIGVWLVINYAGRSTPQVETCYTTETIDGVFTARVGKCK